MKRAYERMPVRAIAGAVGAIIWAAGLACLLLKFGSHRAVDQPTTIIVPIQIVDTLPTPVSSTSSGSSILPKATAAPNTPAGSRSIPPATRQTATEPSRTDHLVARAEQSPSTPSRPEPAETLTTRATPPAPPVPAPDATTKTDPALKPEQHGAPPRDVHASASDDATASASATARDNVATSADGNAGSNASAHARAGAGSADSTGEGNASAHAIYQPLPEVPDEAREEAFSAVATARFSVHADGHCDVDLIQATRNPMLNRLLLASLKQWRFAPATQDGRHIDSTIDLRVHFNIQ